ncbi:hypothetical protein LTS17_005760 [Exophiala oligosperma]
MDPWTPHTFWPDPNPQEDTTILLWAHPNPNDMDDKMDRLFFQNLLMYVSDVAEGKERSSILQVMLIHINQIQRWITKKRKEDVLTV